MDYKAIIFDLDGIICVTDMYHYQAWKRIADEEHIYFDEKINMRLRGVSRLDSLEIVLEKAQRTYTDQEKLELCKRKNEIYVGLLDQMSEKSLAEDTRSTLQTLKRRGVKLAIGSSSKNTKLILSKLGLSGFFDAVSDGTNISNSKPHPEVFIKAVEMLGERPCECLVVEDAVAGIEAAYHGGFASAGIGDAKNHPKVTYKLDKISDLLGLIGNMEKKEVV